MSATVESLWRYPVKSMMGETVESVELNSLGIVGDRTWATRDLERGGIRGAKKIGALMTFAAHALRDGVPLVTFPDGRQVRADAPDADRLLSEALDHRVQLEPLAPIDQLDHYRRGPADSDDMIAELRATFALEGDEPLPDFSVFPPTIMEFESPPGTYYDAFPLLLLTDASLRHLSSMSNEGTDKGWGDVRRFRPSILFAAPGAGFVENDWQGRRAQLGTAVLRIGVKAPRCVMITRGFADLPEDRTIMRTVVRENAQAFGVYGEIETPGVVHVGDVLTLLD
jgi:uncharacterized protein